MREVEPGHDYLLDTYDGGLGPAPWRIRFMKRVGPDYPGNQPPAMSGTNCQEVLRVLIARVKYLNDQKPHVANAWVLNRLREDIWDFELRHAELRGRLERFRDLARGVASNTLENGRPLCVELIPTCSTCGHLFCEEHPQSSGGAR